MPQSVRNRPLLSLYYIEAQKNVKEKNVLLTKKCIFAMININILNIKVMKKTILTAICLTFRRPSRWKKRVWTWAR